MTCDEHVDADDVRDADHGYVGRYDSDCNDGNGDVYVCDGNGNDRTPVVVMLPVLLITLLPKLPSNVVTLALP